MSLQCNARACRKFWSLLTLKLKRDILIQAVIKHQSTFFHLLDYIDSHDGSLEVPESLYMHDYNNIICEDDDENIHMYLSIPSLVENGVFIHNKGTGIISIERIIVDLLRFIDVKRARELTHSDFEFMRVQVVKIVESILQQPMKGQEFKDSMATFNNLMSEIHSKIKENVNTLTVQVESIALKYKDYDVGISQINGMSLHDKVFELYNRFVLPCYEFIDPNMDMVQTHNFSNAVQQLIEYYSEQAEGIGLANIIQLRKTAITSYYKDIAALAEKLVRFSTRLEADRNSYLAIESAFSQLMESIVSLRHGKRKNIYLTSSSAVFTYHTVLDGLSNQKAKFAAKLKWDNEKTVIRFKEYLMLIENKELASSKTTKVQALPATERPNQQKQIKISQILFAEKLPIELPDVHEFVCQLLNSKMDNFSLADVLYGLEVFLPKYKHQTKRHHVISKKRLNDEKYFINYIQLRYSKEADHV